MNYSECTHKNLKYFEQTDKVVCLDCGKSFTEHNQQDFYPSPSSPIIPYNPPNPMPDYPVYPTVTWCKVENK